MSAGKADALGRPRRSVLALGGTTRIVKTVAFIIVGLLAGSTGSPSQAAEKKYVGRAVVVGLGNITFPTGEWSLEFQHMQAPTNGLHLPDYFVFKRGGDRLERLTFLSISGVGSHLDIQQSDCLRTVCGQEAIKFG
jgi:hypothetical protein